MWITFVNTKSKGTTVSKIGKLQKAICYRYYFRTFTEIRGP